MSNGFGEPNDVTLVCFLPSKTVCLTQHPIYHSIKSRIQRHPAMAATIHVHLGQCGNQLGERFWSLAAAANTSGGISELQQQELGDSG